MTLASDLAALLAAARVAGDDAVSLAQLEALPDVADAILRAEVVAKVRLRIDAGQGANFACARVAKLAGFSVRTVRSWWQRHGDAQPASTFESTPMDPADADRSLESDSQPGART